jgi:hypothetical protein
LKHLKSKRFSQFSYTWGHNLGEVTILPRTTAQDSTNFKGDYGNSDFDTRNTFVAYANYDVPGFGGPRLITNGWQLNSVITLKSGQPVNLVMSTDTTGENEYTQRPNIIGNPFAGDYLGDSGRRRSVDQPGRICRPGIWNLR